MSYRRISLLFVALLLLSVTTACAAPTPTPSTPAKPSPAPSPAPVPATTPTPVQPIKLKFAAITAPPPGGRSDAMKWWADEVEKRTNGRVKFEIYWSAALVPATQMLEATKTGICDVAEIIPTQFVGQLPLANLSQLPGTSPDPFVVVQAWREVAKTVPDVTNEITKLNMIPLSWQPTLDNNVLFTKPLRSLAEMKGVKVRAFGTTYPKVMSQAAGIVPVAMAAGEAYDALMRGTVEGVVGTHEGAFRYKWYEVATCMTMWNFGCSATIIICINNDVWKKLPADIQNIMAQVGVEQEKYVCDLYAKEEANYIQQMKEKKNYQIINFSDADKAVIKKASTALWDELATEYEGKGLPAKKVMEAYRAAMDKYSKK